MLQRGSDGAGRRALWCPFTRCAPGIWELRGLPPASIWCAVFPLGSSRCSPAPPAQCTCIFPPARTPPRNASQEPLPSLALGVPVGVLSLHTAGLTRSGRRLQLSALGEELLLGAVMPKKSPRPGRREGRGGGREVEVALRSQGRGRRAEKESGPCDGGCGKAGPGPHGPTDRTPLCPPPPHPPGTGGADSSGRVAGLPRYVGMRASESPTRPDSATTEVWEAGGVFLAF